MLFAHSRQLENYSDDLIWRLDRIGGYADDILKLVDDYGEAFTRQMDADDLSRLGRLVNEGLADDVVDAVIKHADHFADYSDDAIKKIAESGCNAERILTQIDNYAKDFTEDLTAGQLKRLDDILEQGVTPEQFEVLIKHGKQIENYTDEIVGLWKDYTGNGDDFLRLVDEFGDEFVEAFQKNGDEAVDEFKRLLEGSEPNKIFTSGEEWYRYFQDRYGKENIQWTSNSFKEFIEHPTSLRNYSADEIADVLGEGWIRETYGSDGQGWKFIEEAHPDNMIFYHNGGGEHVGAYYGISSGATGRIKVVDSDTYLPGVNDKAYIIYSEDW